MSHDPSEIILIGWFDAQASFHIIINIESSWPASYFLKTMVHFDTVFDDLEIQKNSISLK